MPIYSYICKDCGHKFDLLVGVSSQKEELRCAKCKSENIKKVFGAFSVGHTSGDSGSCGPTCPTGTCPYQ